MISLVAMDYELRVPLKKSKGSILLLHFAFIFLTMAAGNMCWFWLILVLTDIWKWIPSHMLVFSGWSGTWKNLSFLHLLMDAFLFFHYFSCYLFTLRTMWNLSVGVRVPLDFHDLSLKCWSLTKSWKKKILRMIRTSIWIWKKKLCLIKIQFHLLRMYVIWKWFD